jgi:hypothetical protein
LINHIDFFNLPLETGIIHRGYEFRVMDYFPQSALEQKLESEMEFVVKTVTQYYLNFAINSSSRGVRPDVSIPVINVILPPSADRSIAIRLLKTLNSFTFDMSPIRPGTGVVIASGKTYY